MKFLVALLLSLIVFPMWSQVFSSFCVNETNVTVPVEDGDCNNGFWVLAFSDEFDGNTLDLTKWNPTTGVVRDPSHDIEKQWYTPANIEVSNGTVKLTAKEEVLLNQCYTIWADDGPYTSCENFQYSSAEIQSKYKFEQGMAEIRCKIPKGRGFFPAFWLYGGALDGSGSSEIDIFEFWNPSDLDKLSKIVHLNIHGEDNGFSGQCPSPEIDENIDYSADFHIYSVIWDSYKIEWYIDGELKYFLTRWYTISGQAVDCSSLVAGHQYILNPWFPDDPMNIIANFAISVDPHINDNGDESGAGAPDESTPFPSSYEIDYVRYYKRVPCTSSIDFSDFDALNLTTGIYTIIFAGTINVNSSAILEAGEQLALVASDQINLESGFTVQSGADFSATIDPNSCYGAGMIINDQIPSNSESNKIDDALKIEDSGELFCTIYPNPTSSVIFVEFRSIPLSGVKVIMINSMGEKIPVSDNYGSDQCLQIDLQNFTKGVYYLLVSNTNGDQIYATTIIRN